MSEELFTENESQDQDETIGTTELDMLKQRARLMGVPFSNNIKIDTLRERIKAKLEGSSENQDANKEDVESEDQDESQEGASVLKPTSTSTPSVAKKPKVQSLRQRLMEREMRLIRLRIVNLDPKKKDLPGEIFTFANEIVGTVRKYIPYGEATDNGYYVPYCIYKQLRDREFVDIKTKKSKNSTPEVSARMVREFALEILPQHTPEELARLAAMQAAKAGAD